MSELEFDSDDEKNEVWKKTYSEIGNKLVKEIVESANKLEPYVKEIGWKVVDIQQDDGTRIYIQYG